MYLSRLFLNPRSLEVCRDLGDCHEFHRTILKAFPTVASPNKPADKNGVDPKKGARAALGVLHRLEPIPKTNTFRLLVQSLSKPNWNKLPPTYLLDTRGDPVNPDIKDVSDSYKHIVPGMLLAFRLCANPTRRTKFVTRKTGERESIENPKGHRAIICGDAALLQWLKHKGDIGGFEMLSGVVNGDAQNNARELWDAWAVQVGVVRGRQTHNSLAPQEMITHKLTFRRVMFDGRLRVTDRDRFLGTLQRGIGSGKAYGFGLLSIAPAR